MPAAGIQKESVDLKQLNHNLRNPLYIAKTLLEAHLEALNKFRPSNASGTQETKIILKKSVMEINRALTTLMRLNQLAIAYPKKTVPEHVPQVFVKEVLDRVVAALKEEHYLDHIILIDWVSSKLPPLKGNPIALEEIFYNLIVNAAQAMIGGGQLAIEAVHEGSPISRVSISFRDTGPGIPPEALDHIFEAFYTSRAQNGGTGFGLHIVKELVERNGGTIEVKSRRLIGTTFTISFPTAS